jgi:hypothetical protein
VHTADAGGHRRYALTGSADPQEWMDWLWQLSAAVCRILLLNPSDTYHVPMPPSGLIWVSCDVILCLSHYSGHVYQSTYQDQVQVQALYVTSVEGMLRRVNSLT